MGVDEIESTKSSACGSFVSRQTCASVSCPSLTPMLPLSELSRPSSGVSSATSSSSLHKKDEDGVPYVLSCTSFVLEYIDPFWMDFLLLSQNRNQSEID